MKSRSLRCEPEGTSSGEVSVACGTPHKLDNQNALNFEHAAQIVCQPFLFMVALCFPPPELSISARRDCAYPAMWSCGVAWKGVSSISDGKVSQHRASH